MIHMQQQEKKDSNQKFKNNNKMKYLKLYEEFEYRVGLDAERQRQKAIDAVISDPNHPKRRQWDMLDKEFSSPDSEEGTDWSDSERKTIDKFADTFAKEYEVPSTKEAKLVQLSNAVIATISRYDTCMEEWKKVMDDDRYEPMGDWNKVTDDMRLKFKKLSDEVFALEDKLEWFREYYNQDWDPDAVADFGVEMPTLSTMLEKNPDKVSEAEKLVDLVNQKLDEMEKLMGKKGLDFTLALRSKNNI